MFKNFENELYYFLFYSSAYFFFTGHEIAEVVHDNVPVIKKWVVQELKIKNSFDSWHGKN